MDEKPIDHERILKVTKLLKGLDLAEVRPLACMRYFHHTGLPSTLSTAISLCSELLLRQPRHPRTLNADVKNGGYDDCAAHFASARHDRVDCARSRYGPNGGAIARSR